MGKSTVSLAGKIARKAAGKALAAAKGEHRPECVVCGRPIVGGGRKSNMHAKCMEFAATCY